MKWLDRLKNKKAPDTHATKPTKPPQGEGAAGFVGSVAYPPAPFQKFEAIEAAANDTLTSSEDPDRWCWPHNESLNQREIDTFTSRLERFTNKGVSHDEAERLADKLVLRDRELDDRRLCLECSHLHGAGRWRCGNWHRAGVAIQLKDAHIPRDLVLALQRCPGFGG